MPITRGELNAAGLEAVLLLIEGFEGDENGNLTDEELISLEQVREFLEGLNGQKDEHQEVERPGMEGQGAVEVKGEGEPCSQGERASATGCIPASGETPPRSNPRQERLKQQREALTSAVDSLKPGKEVDLASLSRKLRMPAWDLHRHLSALHREGKVELVPLPENASKKEREGALRGEDGTLYGAVRQGSGESSPREVRTPAPTPKKAAQVISYLMQAKRTDQLNLADVRESLGNPDPEHFHKVIRELWQARAITLSNLEGRHGISEAEREAAIFDPREGPSGGFLGLLQVKDPEKFREVLEGS